MDAALTDLSNEARRTLETACAQEPERRVWSGRVRYDHGVPLRVGWMFDLRTERSPMGEHVGRYRLAAMALAPEGYTVLVGFEDDWQPPNGAPVPEVNRTMLVP